MPDNRQKAKPLTALGVMARRTGKGMPIRVLYVSIQGLLEVIFL